MLLIRSSIKGYCGKLYTQAKRKKNIILTSRTVFMRILRNKGECLGP